MKYSSRNSSEVKDADLMDLYQLSVGDKALITDYRNEATMCSEKDLLSRRFFELGVIKGEYLELVHKSPFPRGPVAVQVLGSLIGLNHEEAQLVLVKKEVS